MEEKNPIMGVLVLMITTPAASLPHQRGDGWDESVGNAVEMGYRAGLTPKRRLRGDKVNKLYICQSGSIGLCILYCR